MSTVLLDMAMSLDGFVAGPNNEDGGLHDWYFAPAGNAIGVIDELIDGIGAMILGKWAFGNEPDGWDTPYKVPHFVLTHTARAPIARNGMTFHFSTAGIEGTLAQAKKAAGEKLICIAGGAATAQQFLRAGLVDEVQIHLVPVLMGSGLRLFEHLDSTKLVQMRVLESPAVTHLRYRVMKD